MIPVNEPLLGEQERAYVDECVRTGWVSLTGLGQQGHLPTSQLLPQHLS